MFSKNDVFPHRLFDASLLVTSWKSEVKFLLSEGTHKTLSRQLSPIKPDHIGKEENLKAALVG